MVDYKFYVNLIRKGLYIDFFLCDYTYLIVLEQKITEWDNFVLLVRRTGFSGKGESVVTSLRSLYPSYSSPLLQQSENLSQHKSMNNSLLFRTLFSQQTSGDNNQLLLQMAEL